MRYARGPAARAAAASPAALTRYGHYALHAKLYVLDREELFIGSMNFDFRSRRLNSEMGLLLRNRDLAQQQAARVETMMRPENAYALSLRPGSGRGRPELVWRTVEDGKPVEYGSEPARSRWQKIEARVLSWLPLDPEL